MNMYKAEEEDFYFIPNAGAFVTGWDDVTDFSLVDGVMVEGFSEWGGGQVTGLHTPGCIQYLLGELFALSFLRGVAKQVDHQRCGIFGGSKRENTDVDPTLFT